MPHWQGGRNQRLILPKTVVAAMLSELRLKEEQLLVLIFFAAIAAATDCPAS